LDSSKKTSTFLDVKTWAGESQWLIKKNGDPSYFKNRWDPNYNLNMNIIKNIFDRYLDSSKDILVEKSPPTICRAKSFENYFEKFGKVWFIISIRNPYSCRDDEKFMWVEHAKYQIRNIKTLKNIIITNYEEICLDLPNVIKKIKNKIPELSDLKNKNSDSLKGNRGNMINDKKIGRIIKKNKKNKILKNNKDILHFFNYKYIP